MKIARYKEQLGRLVGHEAASTIVSSFIWQVAFVALGVIGVLGAILASGSSTAVELTAIWSPLIASLGSGIRAGLLRFRGAKAASQYLTEATGRPVTVTRFGIGLAQWKQLAEAKPDSRIR